MRIDIISCDCCKETLDDDTDSSLNGQLLGLGEEEVAVSLDDLCDPCAAALNEAIQDVLLRRGN